MQIKIWNIRYVTFIVSNQNMFFFVNMEPKNELGNHKCA